MRKYFHITVCFVLFLVTHLSSYLYAQDKDYLAILPAFHDRLHLSNAENVLQLANQRFVLFVFRNAVAVYSEADFVNSGRDPVDQEFALPSTGHDENGDLPGGRISTGILGVQLWVQGLRIEPQVVTKNNEEWYTIHAHVLPGESRKIKAVFWAQTSLVDIDSLPGLDTALIPDGHRGLMIDLAHAAIWNGWINHVSIDVVLRQNLLVQQDSFQVVPDNYEVQDSLLSWNLYNVEPAARDNIVLYYSTEGTQDDQFTTLEKLSSYLVKKGYDDLLHFSEKLEE